jgi:NAD(P) transhydrogenase
LEGGDATEARVAIVDVFIRTCFNYPTLGELYKYATYDAMGALQRRNAGNG